MQFYTVEATFTRSDPRNTHVEYRWFEEFPVSGVLIYMNIFNIDRLGMLMPNFWRMCCLSFYEIFLIQKCIWSTSTMVPLHNTIRAYSILPVKISLKHIAIATLISLGRFVILNYECYFMFQVRIGRGGSHPWTAISTDLTPLDICLWDHMKTEGRLTPKKTSC